MGFFSMVKDANRPGPPEDSVVFRASATLAVAIAIAACATAGELSAPLALSCIVLVFVGNAFSYQRRGRPWPMLKVVVAVAVVVAFVWFFATISGAARAGDLASVEGPLAVLFAIIQVTHAFDVPSRRDLGFSLAGSATLMAVAGAQAVDDAFAIYVLAWAIVCLVGLEAMWSSMVGGTRLRPVGVAAGALAVLFIGVVVVAALPAPHANSSLVLPSSLAGDLAVQQPAGLVGGGSRGNQPVHAASPQGPTRVGGFLGFAGPLNTADRASLGTTVVFRVRADRPSFWVAETFDEWTGQSWIEAKAPRGASPWRAVVAGSPFSIPPPAGEPLAGPEDYQTFYLAVPGPNLIFHAANASEVWFPSRDLYVNDAGTIRSGTSLGPGSVYTVLSQTNVATPAQLNTADHTLPSPGGTLFPTVSIQATQLPHPYPRVHALAEAIVSQAHATTTFEKVAALEAWIGHHTRYTLDIPPLAPGQDTVTEFLFGNRRGYCEQISTALAVMLRTLGVPAREATGYVPGPYDPVTDLYTVQAKDAHAWVQVWFPGYGWQSFDPTAQVPLANPTPGSVIAHDLAHALGRVPWVPVLALATLAGIVALVVRRRRRAPAGWAATVTFELETAARRAGCPATAADSLVTVARRLDVRRGPPGRADPAAAWAAAAEAAAFGGREPDPATQHELIAKAKDLRRGAAALRAPAEPVSSTTGPTPQRSEPRVRAGAGRP